MNQVTSERLVSTLLLPLFAGSRIRSRRICKDRRSRQSVAYADGQRGLKIRFNVDSTIYEYIIRRAQRFDEAELEVAWSFLDAIDDIADAIGKPFEAEVLDQLSLRVIARALRHRAYDTLLDVLRRFAKWEATRYEGKPIAASVGIDPKHPADESSKFVKLAELSDPLAQVLTNGLDTLLVADGDGLITGYKALDLRHVSTPNLRRAAPSYAPLRFAALAAWTRDYRCSVVLTRTGEILIFQGQKLRFARLRGQWQHFTHGSILKTIRFPWRTSARTAMYETLLDVSFAKTGGCVGVATSREHICQIARLVANDDDLRKPKSVKSRLLKSILGTASVRGIPFEKIDRRIRAELLALDGATVLDHAGNLVAVGPIIRIGPGSAGGGRLAAAKALASSLGLGIKVSQDGGVQGFEYNHRKGNAPLFAFG